MIRLFRKYMLQVPLRYSIRLSRNLTIHPSVFFEERRNLGFLRNLIQNISWSKGARLIQKLQQGVIGVPLQVAGPASIHSRRFTCMKEAIKYNSEYIPYFAASVSVIPFP